MRLKAPQWLVKIWNNCVNRWVDTLQHYLVLQNGVENEWPFIEWRHCLVKYRKNNELEWPCNIELDGGKANKSSWNTSGHGCWHKEVMVIILLPCTIWRNKPKCTSYVTHLRVFIPLFGNNVLIFLSYCVHSLCLIMRLTHFYLYRGKTVPSSKVNCTQIRTNFRDQQPGKLI